MSVRNIFVMGLEDFNRKLLETVRGADGYRFHSLLAYQELVRRKRYSASRLLEQARRQLQSFPGPIDAIVDYWDFPATTLAPILRRELGLPTPSLEAVLKCEHKFWSRLIQRQVAPELVPAFRVFDPFAADPLAHIDLDFPFWVKPIRAHSSFLGFRVDHAAGFHVALERIRRQIARIAEPFNDLLQFAELPPEVAPVDGYHCLAEEIISARRQCTLEGFDYQGRTEIYGVVDSLRKHHDSCFSRYRYPSHLPPKLQERMTRTASRVMAAIGLHNSPFNIEFFHDPDRDRLTLLEVNPRISKSHSPLFALVDGASQMEVMIDLALGRRPDFSRRRGRGDFPLAAKFMLRRFADAEVQRVPGNADLVRLRENFPEALFQSHVRPGDRLSDLQDQDSYSFEYAVLFLGGRSLEDLENKYRSALKLLPFVFDDSSGGSADLS